MVMIPPIQMLTNQPPPGALTFGHGIFAGLVILCIVLALVLIAELVRLAECILNRRKGGKS